jgi:hypothetical protein
VARGGPPSPYDPEDDAAFAALAGILRLVREGWRQCPRLVHAPRGSQYCSKACSNASFAARKGEVEPRYFASKQAAYRQRQRRRQEAPRDVFAFVD